MSAEHAWFRNSLTPPESDSISIICYDEGADKVVDKRQCRIVRRPTKTPATGPVDGTSGTVAPYRHILDMHRHKTNVTKIFEKQGQETLFHCSLRRVGTDRCVYSYVSLTCQFHSTVIHSSLATRLDSHLK